MVGVKIKGAANGMWQLLGRAEANPDVVIPTRMISVMVRHVASVHAWFPHATASAVRVRWGHNICVSAL